MGKLKFQIRIKCGVQSWMTLPILFRLIFVGSIDSFDIVRFECDDIYSSIVQYFLKV